MSQPPPPYSPTEATGCLNFPPIATHARPATHHHRPSCPSHTYAPNPCPPSFLEPLSPAGTNSLHAPGQTRNERGLGGLVVGLGTAAMLHHALSHQSPPHAPAPVRAGEDPLSVLARYDTIFLVDDSASMSDGSRWREAGLAISGLADAVTRYDTDGIDVYFMNSTQFLRNARSSAEVNQLFQQVRPLGLSTPTDVRVEELLGAYLDRLEIGRAQSLPPVKPVNLIVITDGEADDPDTLAYALIGFAERLDQGRFPLSQLGVQFIQIGKEKAATRALKNLDDELKSAGGARRDIVDTTPYKGTVTTEFLIKALLGGINKRIDRS